MSDLDEVAAILGTAFVSEPHVRHLVGPNGVEPGVITQFMRLMLEHVFIPLENVWLTDDRASAMVGAPPGCWRVSDEAVMALAGPLTELVGADHLPAFLRAVEAAEAAHPEQEHWYGVFLGTMPDRRRKGSGSGMLNFIIDECDQLGLPFYLETAKAENVALYERFGFRVVQTISLPDDGPLLWTMWREPCAHH